MATRAILCKSSLVRAIPQIIYFALDNVLAERAKKELSHATIRNYQELWDAGILANFNVLSSDPYPDIDEYAAANKQWRAMGRHWLAKVGMASNAEQVEEKWAKPMRDPRIDGGRI